MYIRRILTNKLYKLAESFPVVVISGARQVGKSTLLQNTLAQMRKLLFLILLLILKTLGGILNFSSIITPRPDS